MTTDTRTATNPAARAGVSITIRIEAENWGAARVAARQLSLRGFPEVGHTLTPGVRGTYQYEVTTLGESDATERRWPTTNPTT